MVVHSNINRQFCCRNNHIKSSHSSSRNVYLHILQVLSLLPETDKRSWLLSMTTKNDIPVQLSAIITRSNIVRCYINNYRNWGRISIRCWIHKRHPIPRPNGRAMGCLLWIFVKKLTMLQWHSTVCTRNISSWPIICKIGNAFINYERRSKLWIHTLMG